jgi:uncharacterized protein YoxC
MLATWQLIMVVLLAVLVGAAVPVLIQLRRTLKTAESVLEQTAPRLDRTLEEVTEAAARLNRLGKTLERDAEGLSVFTDAAAGLGRSLKSAQESLRVMSAVGAAVGPAIAAGLRSLFSGGSHDETEPVEAGDDSAARSATGTESRP